MYLSLLDSYLWQLSSREFQYNLKPDTPRGQRVGGGFPGELTGALPAGMA